MVQPLRAFADLAEDPSLAPASTWKLKTACNLTPFPRCLTSSSDLLGLLHIHDAYKNMQANIDTQSF